MSTTIGLQYGVTFGKGDSSDWIDWETELDGEEEIVYLRAKMLHIPLEDVPELESVLDAAYEEIKDEAIDSFIDYDDEYVLECTGRESVDPDYVNELVGERDPHALEYFGLTEMSDEKLEEWDANDLDELPMVCDFQEGFEPTDPFNGGWSLNVEFAEHPEEEDIDEGEARETIRTLLCEAKGDFSVLLDYVKRCEDLYYGDDTDSLEELAEAIAKELGIEGAFTSEDQP